MPFNVTPNRPHSPFRNSSKRRSAWREKLIEAERGAMQGVRGSSALFFHFFTGTIVIAAGAVIRLELIEWCLLIVALTMVLAAEMFNQVLKAIAKSLEHHFADEVHKAMRIGTAAVFVAAIGAVLSISLMFGQRLFGILAG